MSAQEQERGSASELTQLLDASQFPKLTLMERAYWRLRNALRWPQCKRWHMPYAHLTDEECNSFWVGRGQNKKIYYCMRRRWHLGKCEDVHGRRW